MKPIYGFRYSCPLACVPAVGAVLWWNRCRSSDDAVAGIFLSFRGRSEQVQCLKHLSPNTAEAEPSLHCIGLAVVGAPVIFLYAPLDVTYNPFSDGTFTECFQGDRSATYLKRVSHFLRFDQLNGLEDTTAKLRIKTKVTKTRKTAARLLISSCPSMKANKVVIKSSGNF